MNPEFLKVLQLKEEQKHKDEMLQYDGADVCEIL